MGRSTHTGLSLLAAMSACLGCEPGLEVGGAYAEQAYLCEPPSAQIWEDMVADCQQRWGQDQSCAGIISYQGTLDGQPVVFGGELSITTFRIASFEDGHLCRLGLDVHGLTPTYEFDMRIHDLGLPLDMETGFPAFAVAPMERSYVDHSTDGSFRLSNGFQSRDLRVVDGLLAIERYSDSEYEARWTIAYGDLNDRIEGCIHAFPTNTFTDPISGTPEGN